jgi:hypothetical protein
MARNFSSDQQALLRSDALSIRLLTTWTMDGGTYYYCDDVRDLTYGGNTYIGANALASATDIKSAANSFAAESVTITIDGTRLFEAGVTDPGIFFQSILSLPLANRRVDIALGIMGPADENPVLVIPMYAGKINNAKIIDPARNIADVGNPQQSKLEIVLDSLAARYKWIVGRTRTHEDQLEIDPTDQFFAFVHANLQNESTLYWGKKAPIPVVTGIGGAVGGAGNYALNSFMNRLF